MVKKTKVKVYAYRISTPAINTDKNLATDNYYNYELFESFLNVLISSGLDKNIKDGKYFKLHSIQQSDDADVLSGEIHTTKYGQLSDIIDISNDKVVNILQPIQGVKHIVNFVIHRKTGVFLMQSDPFFVASRKSLIEFLEARKEHGDPFVKSFNKKHKPLLLSKQNFYTINTIFDEDFYEQLAQIINVKSVEIIREVDKAEANAALNYFIHNDVNEEDFLDEITHISYQFKNTMRQRGVAQVRRFIERALDFEKIDTLTAHGVQGEKATFDKVKPRKYDITTNISESGVIDNSIIIKEMVNLVKKIR